MKNFIQRFFSEKSEKTHSKMNDMNETISDEFKSRLRQVTAKHKGYEQFSHDFDCPYYERANDFIEENYKYDQISDGEFTNNKSNIDNNNNSINHPNYNLKSSKFQISNSRMKRSFKNIRNRLSLHWSPSVEFQNSSDLSSSSSSSSSYSTTAVVAPFNYSISKMQPTSAAII